MLYSAISLWNAGKKKPLYTRLNAHGHGSRVLENEVDSKNTSGEDSCNWITAISVLQHSDLFATGSGDGYVKLWKISETKKSFSLINSIPVSGFVNSICLFEAPNAAVDIVTAKNSGIVERIKSKEIGLQKLNNAKKCVNLALAIGQEHRLGRWWCIKGLKSHIRVYQLSSL